MEEKNKFSYLLMSFYTGAASLVDLAILFYLKDDLLLSPAQTSRVLAICLLPWSLKPLYGLITDFFPIFNYRRKYYILIFSFLHSVVWILLLFTNNYYLSLFYLFMVNLTKGFVAVLAQAILVECNKETDYQELKKNVSFYFLIKHLGNLFGAFLRGVLVHYFTNAQVFCIASCLPLLNIIAWYNYDEKPVHYKDDEIEYNAYTKLEDKEDENERNYKIYKKNENSIDDNQLDKNIREDSKLYKVIDRNNSSNSEYNNLQIIVHQSINQIHSQHSKNKNTDEYFNNEINNINSKDDYSQISKYDLDKKEIEENEKQIYLSYYKNKNSRKCSLNSFKKSKKQVDDNKTDHNRNVANSFKIKNVLKLKELDDNYSEKSNLLIDNNYKPRQSDEMFQNNDSNKNSISYFSPSHRVMQPIKTINLNDQNDIKNSFNGISNKDDEKLSTYKNKGINEDQTEVDVGELKNFTSNNNSSKHTSNITPGLIRTQSSNLNEIIINSNANNRNNLKDVIKEEDTSHDDLDEKTFIEKIKKVCKTMSHEDFYIPLSIILIFFSVPNYSDPMFYFMTNELLFSPIKLTVLAVANSGGVCFAIILYIHYLKRIQSKTLISYSTIFSFLFGLISFVLVMRWNIELGISDFITSICSYLCMSIMGEITYLPLLSVAASICPVKLEGTIYSMFMSAFSIASFFSNFIGSYITEAFGINSHDFENLPYMIIFCNIISVLPLIYLHVLSEKYLEKGNIVPPEIS